MEGARHSRVNWQELMARMRRQEAFFEERAGNLLVFGDFSEGRRACAVPLTEEFRRNPSEGFLKSHAYDLGLERIREVKARMIDQIELEDDACTPVIRPLHLSPDWGVGATAALFTGQDVVFQEATSYTAKPFLQDWEDLPRLRLGDRNRWTEYDLAFWRGVVAEYEEPLSVCPHRYRSPLDLANDLRGSELFVDLYDEPDRLSRLLEQCTQAIIAVDRLLCEEISLLKTAPGGIQGVTLGKPGMMWLNGDPVDLISAEMGQTYNNPQVERLAKYAGALFFHHHSIGVSRATSVAAIRGLTVQNLAQDPNGPRLVSCIDDQLIAASKMAPVDLDVKLSLRPSPSWDAFFEQVNALEPILERLSEGRFIVRVWAETKSECRRLVETVRRYQHTRK